MGFVGCSEESINRSNVTAHNFEYLDIDFADTSVPVEQIQAISEKFQERMNEYIIVKDGLYEYTVSSGAEINVSERLFNRAVDILEANNQEIRDGKLILTEDGTLSEFETRSYSSVCKCICPNCHSTKPPVVEKEKGLYGSKTTIYYDSEQALDYYSDFVYGGPSLFTGFFGIGLRGAGVVDLFWEINKAYGIAIFSVDFMLWIESLSIEGLAEKMFNAIRIGSIKVESVQDNLTGNFTITVYDKDGNYVGRHTFRGIPPGQ